MRQKYAGIFMIALSVALFFVLFSMTQSVQKLNAFLHQDCDLPADVCPLHKSVPPESLFGFALDGLVGVFGVYLFLSKDAPSMTAQAKSRAKEIAQSLQGEEKDVFMLVANAGVIFQSEIVEKTGLQKVKVTRILDKLESKGMIERKRRGMSNVVALKQ